MTTTTSLEPTPAGVRLVSLEAARGVAAFIVLVHHYVLGFAPGLKIAWASTPLGLLQNGASAVIFFFVLSGFVLTLRAFESGDARRLGLDAAKRWPRLWLAPALSALLGFLVLVLHLNFNRTAASLSGSQWLGSFANSHMPDGFHPSLPDALGQTVTLWFGAFPWYNSSLWTMQWELLGSFVAFGLAALVAGQRTSVALLVMLVAGAALTGSIPYTMPFVFGSALAMLLARSRLRLGRVAGAMAILIGLALLCYETSDRMFVLVLRLPPNARDEAGILIQALGAVLTILGLRSRLEPMFSGSFARWLGRMSFPVYLVQVIAVCTLGSWLFTHANAGPVVRYGVTALGTLALTLLLAVPFSLLDAWWVATVNRLAKRLAANAGSAAYR